MAKVTGNLSNFGGSTNTPETFTVKIDGDHWEIEGSKGSYYMPGNGLDNLRALRVAITSAMGQQIPRETMVTMSIRVPKDLRNGATATATERGDNLSEKIREFLISYIEGK